MSTAFHPETDGQTERATRTLIDMLRHYVSPVHDDWDEHQIAAEFTANNAWQESIRMLPFMMNSGQNPLTPATLCIPGVENPPAMKVTESLQERLACAKHWMETTQQRQKAYADQERRPESSKVGQDVLLNTANINFKGPGAPKLMPKWIGPYKVVREIPGSKGTTYELDLPVNLRIHDTFHVDLLKPYRADGRV
jgi:hypothetical protein